MWWENSNGLTRKTPTQKTHMSARCFGLALALSARWWVAFLSQAASVHQCAIEFWILLCCDWNQQRKSWKQPAPHKKDKSHTSQKDAPIQKITRYSDTKCLLEHWDIIFLKWKRQIKTQDQIFRPSFHRTIFSVNPIVKLASFPGVNSDSLRRYCFSFGFFCAFICRIRWCRCCQYCILDHFFAVTLSERAVFAVVKISNRVFVCPSDAALAPLIHL